MHNHMGRHRVLRRRPTDFKPGQFLDVFYIHRRVEQDPLGIVFEVEYRGRRFALKFSTHLGGRRVAPRTDFPIDREAICLSGFDHPSLPRMWSSDYWPDPDLGYRYLLLDWIDGDTLEQWAERTHPTPHELVVLLDKLCSVLEHLHERRVVHRDLNLSNILVRASDNMPVLINLDRKSVVEGKRVD